jgi:hypothetical protein
MQKISKNEKLHAFRVVHQRVEFIRQIPFVRPLWAPLWSSGEVCTATIIGVGLLHFCPPMQ